VFGTTLSLSQLLARTWRDALEDDVLGLAAQLSYYFFLALFPAILVLLAIASFLPLSNLTDDLVRVAGPFLSPQVLDLVQEQMRRLANNQNGGLLTFGLLGALWSSSSALVSIAGALNRAYDIEESRPWWKVRLIALGLTLGVALFVLVALSLVLLGPTMAEALGRSTGWGEPFRLAWLVLQWPLVVFLVSTALGLIYYFGPDAEQDWVWITPGAVVGALLWLVVSLVFKFYIANFTDYNATNGAVGGVIVLLLWFYVSSLAVLAGAELNAEIEHASPHAEAAPQKSARGKLLIGRRALRAFREAAGRASPPPPEPRSAPLRLPDLEDISTVVFDVDGTLVDSNGAHAAAWSEALREHGVQCSTSQIRPLVGMGADKLLPLVAGVDEDADLGRAIAERKKVLFARHLNALRPTRGARALVSHLRRLNKTVVVATSAGDDEMRTLLEQAGVADLIEDRASKDDASRSKPDPDIVLAALDQGDADRTRTIMVGDTPYDVEAAARAGVGSVALRSGGHWTDRDLAGAVGIFDDPGALLLYWLRRPAADGTR
jgi:membrane protein